jgi:hypothetical protein
LRGEALDTPNVLSLQEKELQALYMLHHVLNLFRQHAAELGSTGDIEKLSEHSEIFADEFNADFAVAGEHFAGALGCVMHVSCSSKRDE